MVTTRRAEGFSPPTTKGTEPPASVDANVLSYCGGVGGGAVWMWLSFCKDAAF